MAFNYYEGWSEAELLAERRLVQQSLSTGRTTEVRLAGESVRNDDRNATPLEVTLERLAYALYVLYTAGQTTSGTAYTNPYSRNPGVTVQIFQ